MAGKFIQGCLTLVRFSDFSLIPTTPKRCKSKRRDGKTSRDLSVGGKTCVSQCSSLPSVVFVYEHVLIFLKSEIIDFWESCMNSIL
ncbi:hypothetical protein LSTR_LSTR002352, partial [Laodelphax striatellus]